MLKIHFLQYNLNRYISFFCQRDTLVKTTYIIERHLNYLKKNSNLYKNSHTFSTYRKLFLKDIFTLTNTQLLKK